MSNSDMSHWEKSLLMMQNMEYHFIQIVKVILDDSGNTFKTMISGAKWNIAFALWP